MGNGARHGDDQAIPRRSCPPSRQAPETRAGDQAKARSNTRHQELAELPGCQPLLFRGVCVPGPLSSAGVHWPPPPPTSHVPPQATVRAGLWRNSLVSRGGPADEMMCKTGRHRMLAASAPRGRRSRYSQLPSPNIPGYHHHPPRTSYRQAVVVKSRKERRSCSGLCRDDLRLASALTTSRPLLPLGPSANSFGCVRPAPSIARRGAVGRRM